METVLVAAAVILVVNFLASSVRVLLGPAGRDRLSALVLLSTTGAAVLAVLAELMEMSGLRDAALAIVALATITVIVRVVAERESTSERPEP